MPHCRRMRTAVVGHTEWIEFGHVERVPAAGDIVHATDAWEEPGGGGAVAAVQLARLAGVCTFFTAFGDDERGGWSRRRLEELGVRVEHGDPGRADPPGRHVRRRERRTTITTLGRRLEPTAADALPWDELEGVDAVYVTAGDPGALREARSARVLVAHEPDRGPARAGRPAISTPWSAAPPIPRRPFDPEPSPSAAPGRSNRERPRRPVRDERRPHRHVRPGLPAGTRRRHVRRRRLVRGGAHVRARRRHGDRGGVRARRAMRSLVRRRERTVREPAHRDRPLGERRDLHPVVFANVGRCGERRGAEHAGLRRGAPRGSSRARERVKSHRGGTGSIPYSRAAFRPSTLALSSLVSSG